MAMGTIWPFTKDMLGVSSSNGNFQLPSIINSEQIVFKKEYVWYVLQISLFSGVREAFNPFAVLELSPANLEVGEVRIKGLETGLYLGMDSEGRLYTESDPTNESTVFIESAEGHYLTYLR